MNIGKQTKAFWRASEKHRGKWSGEKPDTAAKKEFGQYLITCERQRGFAAGWIAGVAWAKRQTKV